MDRENTNPRSADTQSASIQPETMVKPKLIVKEQLATVEPQSCHHGRGEGLFTHQSPHEPERKEKGRAAGSKGGPEDQVGRTAHSLQDQSQEGPRCSNAPGHGSPGHSHRSGLDCFQHRHLRARRGGLGGHQGAGLQMRTSHALLVLVGVKVTLEVLVLISTEARANVRPARQLLP